MLDTLRRGAAGWLAKILLALLVVSFALWGVPEFVRQLGPRYIAKVGSAEISQEEFRSSYQRQLDQLRQRTGGRVTAEQARAFGFDNQVLSRLIGGVAIDSHAGELGLALPEAAVVDMIRRDPNFRGPSGAFDRNAFDFAIRQAGMTERGYVSIRRKDEVREQITETLTGAVALPPVLADITHRYREERRTVSHFTIDAAKVTVATEPDEAKLKEAFEATKQRYTVPEQRKVSVLVLSVDALKAAVAIPEDDIKASYERDRESFAVAERRQILQIPFKGKAEAEAARAKIIAGQSFDEAGKEAGAADSDIRLGLLSRREMIDAKIAETAFALEKDKVSEVTEGRFATVLLKVTDIQPGRQRPLEEVRGEIRDGLARTKAGEEVQKLHDQVDDFRSAGKRYAEIAETLELKVVEIAAIDRSGNGADGKPAYEGADVARIAEAAFAGRIGADSDGVEIADGGYAWVDVQAITPERLKALDEVRAEVKSAWQSDERRRAIQSLAAKLAERAGQGEDFARLAAEAGGKVEVAKDFKRFGAQPGLTEAAVATAFTLAAGKAASTETADRGSRIVLRLDAVTPAPAPGKDESERLKGELSRQLQSDALNVYVSALQDRLGVVINQAEFRRATGAEAPQ